MSKSKKTLKAKKEEFADTIWVLMMRIIVCRG
jgi:hypothetical protein